MSEENNNEELRPTKMRGVAFPKAKYGVILAVIIIIVVNIIYYKETILVVIGLVLWIGWHVITEMQESQELQKLARKRHSANDHKSNITDW